MVKVDLITGFLGAGKTTFLKKLAQYLIEEGHNLGILENDFGAVNVDMMLLQDLLSEQCELEMVAGGCDYDCHKRRFKTKLIAMGMCGYHRVLIEPSGIYDTDEFFDVLAEEPLDRWYEIGNVWMILDGDGEGELSKQARYLLASQLAVAGKIIISRGEKKTEADIEMLRVRLQEILQEFGCKRRLTKEMILCKDWETFSREDYEDLLTAGYARESYQKLWFDQEEAFSSLYFMEENRREDELKEMIGILMSNPDCYGNIFRIKGFCKSDAGGWKELNAIREEVYMKEKRQEKENLHIREVKEGQDVQIVIGEDLKEDAIRRLFAEYGR